MGLLGFIRGFGGFRRVYRGFIEFQELIGLMGSWGV